MAVNQSQVDHIISTASADDPEVKLLKLQDEVDLIKISIKKLLIDIRERMNELENPFAGPAHGQISGEHQGDHQGDLSVREGAAAAREAAAAAREAAAAARDANRDTTDKTEGKKESQAVQSGSELNTARPPPPPSGTPAGDAGVSRDLLLEELKAQILTSRKAESGAKDERSEKLRLQKVYRLFGWTSKNVRKYGHDRLEMMLESYRAMGYISKEACEQVKEISHLMPASIGDVHEIGADEYVSELYALNGVLDPTDTTLDRDMIEVLMDQKRRLTAPSEKNQIRDKEGEERWGELNDRV